MVAVRRITEGSVYYPKAIASRRTHRRVIAVIDNRVIYSSGGDRNYECSLPAFKKATADTPINEAQYA